MSTWNETDLRSIAGTDELKVAGRRNDGTLRTLTIVWHVVVDGRLYVRSVRGSDGQWYRGVIRYHEGAVSWDGETHDVVYVPDASIDGAIDAAYVEKYGDNSASRSIRTPEARATTLRVEPR